MGSKVIIDDTTIEDEPKSIWKKLVAIVVIAHIAGWLVTYLFIGPPETHLMYYAVVPAMLVVLALVASYLPLRIVSLP
ncbi:MAG: hypothetical protein ACFFEJ_18165 [Candidatus Thorarchaeota archaeon]